MGSEWRKVLKSCLWGGHSNPREQRIQRLCLLSLQRHPCPILHPQRSIRLTYSGITTSAESRNLGTLPHWVDLGLLERPGKKTWSERRKGCCLELQSTNGGLLNTEGVPGHRLGPGLCWRREAHRERKGAVHAWVTPLAPGCSLIR